MIDNLDTIIIYIEDSDGDSFYVKPTTNPDNGVLFLHANQDGGVYITAAQVRKLRKALKPYAKEVQA